MVVAIMDWGYKTTRLRSVLYFGASTRDGAGVTAYPPPRRVRVDDGLRAGERRAERARLRPEFRRGRSQREQRHDGRVAARAEEDEFTVFVHDRLSEFWRSRRLEASLGSSSLEIRSAID